MKEKRTLTAQQVQGETLVVCDDPDAWNQFALRASGQQMVTIAHNPSLGGILSRSFGYRNENYWIMRGTDRAAILPVVYIGKKAVSMPHFSYGGPMMADVNGPPPDLNTLLDAKKFEIREFEQTSPYFYDGKLSCILKLEGSTEDVMMTLKSKLRQKIRKAGKKGYRVAHGGMDLLEDYYGIYAQKMLRFGSPPIGKRFFKNLLTDYRNGDCLISVLYDGDKVIAAACSLGYLNFFEVCWSATDADYDRYNIHALICWEILTNAKDLGYPLFSFGRSTIGSNNHNFKKQWNPVELPIYYNYSHPVGTSLKDMTFLTKIWRKQPLGTSIVLGHQISKFVY